jgi:hypothetical protein
MTGIGMAADAIWLFFVGYPVRCNLAHEVPVTIQAVGIQHGGIAGLNANRISKFPKGKRHGMMITVAGLYEPLAGKIVRHMAVAAYSVSMVAGFFPAFELIAHNMAVRTSLWIVRKIGSSAGIIKSISAGTQQHPDQCTDQRPHPVIAPTS